jgi:hypothetical protein
MILYQSNLGIYFLMKISQTEKNFVCSRDLLRKGHAFWVKDNMGPKCFFKILCLWVLKDAEFEVDSNNINLP